MLNIRSQQFKITALASTFLALQLFVFSPLAILLENIVESDLSITVLLSYAAPFVLGCIFLLLALWYLLSEKFNRILVPLISALAILVWMQSNILFADYGQLDGTTIDFSVHKTREVLEIILWISAISSFILLYKKFKPFLVEILSTLFIFQILLSGWQTISVISDVNFSMNDLYKKEDTSGKSFDSAYYELSPEKNIIHIIPDSFQSNIFAEIVNDNPEYKKQLHGFSFFKNNMGLFPTTLLTMPAMISGEVYDGTLTYKELWSNISDNNVQQKLAESGYRSDIKPAQHVRKFMCLSDYSNCFDYIKPSNKYEYYQYIDIGIFRAVPNIIKKLIYNNDNWFLLNYFTNTNVYKFPQSSEALYFEDFSENLIINDTADPIYKFLHLIPPHMPFRLDSECNLIDKRAISKAAQKDQSHCITKLILKLVQNLKKSGIYDNTMIIISSDHGFRGSHYKFAPNYKKYQHTAIAGRFNKMIASSMPLLLVKPFFEDSDFKTVNTYTSIQDIPNTILDAADLTLLAKGSPIFTIDPEAMLTRQFHFFLRGPKVDDLPPIITFNVSGPPADPDSWRFHDINRELIDNVKFRDLIIEPLPGRKKNSFFNLDEYKDYFTFGWDVRAEMLNDSQWAIWSLGKSSTILMELPENTLKMTATLRSFPFEDPQQIKVFFNNEEIANWKNIDTENFHEYSAIIPDGKRPDINQIRFEYVHVYPVNPEAQQEAKPVAIALSQINFQQVED